MTDRELLELAAKAADINYPWHENEFGGGFKIELGGGYARFWNPLSDDGDALRLAVKLSLSVDVGIDKYTDVSWLVEAEGGHDIYSIEEWFIKHNGDIYAATRRAIVRAAAEIGKTK